MEDRGLEVTSIPYWMRGKIPEEDRIGWRVCTVYTIPRMGGKWNSLISYLTTYNANCVVGNDGMDS